MTVSLFKHGLLYVQVIVSVDDQLQSYFTDSFQPISVGTTDYIQIGGELTGTHSAIAPVAYYERSAWYDRDFSFYQTTSGRMTVNGPWLGLWNPPSLEHSSTDGSWVSCCV